MEFTNSSSPSWSMAAISMTSSRLSSPRSSREVESVHEEFSKIRKEFTTIVATHNESREHIVQQLTQLATHQQQQRQKLTELNKYLIELEKSLRGTAHAQSGAAQLTKVLREPYNGCRRQVAATESAAKMLRSDKWGGAKTVYDKAVVRIVKQVTESLEKTMRAQVEKVRDSNEVFEQRYTEKANRLFSSVLAPSMQRLPELTGSVKATVHDRLSRVAETYSDKLSQHQRKTIADIDEKICRFCSTTPVVLQQEQVERLRDVVEQRFLDAESTDALFKELTALPLVNIESKIQRLAVEQLRQREKRPQPPISRLRSEAAGSAGFSALEEVRAEMELTAEWSQRALAQLRDKVDRIDTQISRAETGCLLSGSDARRDVGAALSCALSEIDSAAWEKTGEVARKLQDMCGFVVPSDAAAPRARPVKVQRRRPSSASRARKSARN